MSPTTSPRLSACLLLFVFVDVAVCFPVSLSLSRSSEVLQRREPDPRCAIEANPAFYGLGIRVGIYLQWITALGSNLLLAETVGSNLTTNAVFLLALFTATVFATLQRTIHVAEVIVLLQLSFGSLFSVLSVWGHRVRAHHGSDEPIRFPLLGSFFRLTLATALSAYGVWFWVTGARHVRQPEGCAAYIFLFTRADVAGGVRIFFQVQSVLVFVAYGLLFIREHLTIICFFVFVSCWTSVVALLTVPFTPQAIQDVKQGKFQDLLTRPEDDTLPPEARKKIKGKALVKMVPKYLLLSFIQWLSIATSLAWKQLNGKQSTGPNRPRLRYYLVPFLDFWILSLQACCIIAFNWHPLGAPRLFVRKLTKKFIRMRAKDAPGVWDRLSHFSRNSRHLQRAVYAFNAICIVWTIISVELTLSWNQIEGIYDVQSTGQLIPLIIGVVGILGLLQSLSVQSCAVRTTNVLMSLLDDQKTEQDDPQTERDEPVYDHSMAVSRDPSRASPKGLDLTFSLPGGLEAAFWINCPRRRHSIDLPPTEHSGGIAPPSATGPGSADLFHGEDSHLYFLPDPRALRKMYKASNVEEYAAQSGRKFWFIKDYRDLTESWPDARLYRSTSIGAERYSTTWLEISSVARSRESEGSHASGRRSRSVNRLRPRFNNEAESILRSFTAPLSSSPSSANGHLEKRPDQQRKTRPLIDIVQLCGLFCIIYTVHFFLAPVFWPFLGPLLPALSPRLRSTKKMMKEKYPNLSGSAFRAFSWPLEGFAEAEHDRARKYSTPHIREKSFEQAINAEAIKKAFKSQSFQAFVEAISAGFSNHYRDINRHKDADYFEGFGVLTKHAKDIRMQKCSGQIGPTVQHEKVKEKWRELEKLRKSMQHDTNRIQEDVEEPEAHLHQWETHQSSFGGSKAVDATWVTPVHRAVGKGKAVERAGGR
ncbi:hypothetical protein F4780DRAFT_783282 [Xylariomycetidae sp. FL0641]|nr:hypothetical protein F4780DRAFT_783282 [Xylariomycetidae sp. FL0641]